MNTKMAIFNAIRLGESGPSAGHNNIPFSFKSFVDNFLDNLAGVYDRTIPDHEDIQNANIMEKRILIHLSQKKRLENSMLSMGCQ